MVLNFFQLRNYTASTFHLANTENSKDDYTVGPYDKTSRHDMWLAQGTGLKGVTVLTYSDGSSVQPFLYMWDEGWAIRYYVGGESRYRSIAVNGNKDFSIDVYDDYFVFVCYNGTFMDSTNEVRVDNWKHIY